MKTRDTEAATALSIAQELERTHNKLLAANWLPEQRTRLWETALDFRRVHHELSNGHAQTPR